jgi:hypothetical protein
VAVLRGLAGTDADVKVVFRQQVLAAKVRCFFCVLTGGRIACVEVRCPHLLAVRAPPFDPQSDGLALKPHSAGATSSSCRDADDLGRRTIRSAHESLAPGTIAGESNSKIRALQALMGS